MASLILKNETPNRTVTTFQKLGPTVAKVLSVNTLLYSIFIIIYSKSFNFKTLGEVRWSPLILKIVEFLLKQPLNK